MKKLPSLSLISFYHLTSLLFIFVQSARPPFACDPSNKLTKSFPFCRTSLPISERVIDLVSRLRLDEKVLQLADTATAIPRLGIPAYEWWSEALHGVAFLPHVSSRQGIHFKGTITNATNFPQVILTAATFDTHLWYRIGQVAGKEARAIYNTGQATGMTFWSPNINIFRDPRWGRGQETAGEDPLVSGKYAVSFVRGIQGDSYEGGALGEHLQASACCKHFTAYDLDRWKNMQRFIFNAKVTKQDMADTFQPPFKSCVQEGRASGIMCSYNQVNGIPNCADYNLLSKTARGYWGFQGYITSDCDAVAVMHENQTYAKTPEDAAADVLKAGMDVDCGYYLKNYTKSAIEKKKLKESAVDRALHNLFSIRMRLGLFNGDPAKLPYGNICANQVCSQKHQAIALEAARDGIVLLKNSDQLPLSKSKTKSLAVIGPNADNATILLGNYAGPPCRAITPLQGLKDYIKNTKYHKGCNKVACPLAQVRQAVKIAQGADQVVLVMGLDQEQEREETDRINLVLPGKQQKLITSVAQAARKPVVLVLLCGGPVDVSFAKNNKKIGSILWAGYPGQYGGTALAEIIFGDYNPGGRLPMTWYPQEFTKIPMTDMRMRADSSSGYPGRTYRFYEGRKVFEFGYGLSYSNYSYELVSVTPNKIILRSSTHHKTERSNPNGHKLVSELGEELCEKSKFSVVVRVKNQGVMTGKHPVLLFGRQAKVEQGSPMKKLVGFQSIKLNAGESAEIEFKLKPCEHLSRTNEDGLTVMDEGSQYLLVGDRELPINVIV
ncbi:hypothetical protein P3X46_021726 [Hevea brasiliensis]|uniref:Fibronectin type III-like domain-containing protein n=1 Tax=Hevea brasiliensis TaxID=3981 RepID=A0ABQ9LGG6_HEVBR|nr:probable beta-D-xylosidase 7 [Hevea brasiliensis]KAJ9167044.1 hypothetical protein P3X46_021726 [Hevea brasiliensis]